MHSLTLKVRLLLQKAAGELGAQATQAVPTMLELVPTGKPTLESNSLVAQYCGLQHLSVHALI